MKHLTLTFVTILSATLASSAFAATQNLKAGVAFVQPVAISNAVDADFGNVTGGVGSTKYVLDTSGNVTVGSGPGKTLAGGNTRRAASFTIAGANGQTVSIKSGSYSANNGVTPSEVTCKYGSGSATACDAGITGAAAVGGTTLAMGLAITTSGNESGGSSANPTFIMTVDYQ